MALPAPSSLASESLETTFIIDEPVTSTTDEQDDNAKHADRVRAFYVGIGQRRISRQKVTTGVNVLADLEAQGFTSHEIEIGLQWITKHQKDLGGTIYSLSLLPEVIGQALAAEEPPRSWPGAAILAPMDLRGESRRDIREAEQIARAFGTGLVLMHVVPPLQAPPWYRSDLSAHQRMQVTKAQRQLESLAGTVGPGVKTEIRVAAGRPADEISALAAEERIGLVVMHLRKGPGLLGSRAGSIAAHVLRHAVTPVLALPSRPVSRPVKARASSRARARSSR